MRAERREGYKRQGVKDGEGEKRGREKREERREEGGKRRDE
jgi:hypothetical protein